MISSSTARTLSNNATSSIAIASSSAALFIDQKIVTAAVFGGTYVIDPLNGYYDTSLTNELQSSIWTDLANRGFVITEANADIVTGSFKVAPTVKISW